MKAVLVIKFRNPICGKQIVRRLELELEEIMFKGSFSISNMESSGSVSA